MPPELQISEDGLTRTLALIESEGKLALAMALIDPGANVVIASTELAETLKLRETGTGEMGTAAGPHTASPGRSTKPPATPALNDNHTQTKESRTDTPHCAPSFALSFLKILQSDSLSNLLNGDGRRTIPILERSRDSTQDCRSKFRA